LKNSEKKDLTHNHGAENGLQFHPADRKNGNGIENRDEKAPKYLSLVAT
jgi:hypothetical protein